MTHGMNYILTTERTKRTKTKIEKINPSFASSETPDAEDIRPERAVST